MKTQIGMSTLVISGFFIAILTQQTLISHAQSNAETIVKERQDLMKTMGRSFGPLIAVQKGESTDLAAATEAAQTMHDAIVKAAGMFPTGSATGEVSGSRAKPEVWTNAAEFKAASDDLINETAKLVEISKSGDLEAFKVQFPIVGRSCGGCHKGKGAEGGKFRTPKDG